MFKWLFLFFVIGLELDKEPEVEKIDSLVSVKSIDSNISGNGKK